jgi:hypothetical protein
MKRPTRAVLLRVIGGVLAVVVIAVVALAAVRSAEDDSAQEAQPSPSGESSSHAPRATPSTSESSVDPSPSTDPTELDPATAEYGPTEVRCPAAAVSVGDGEAPQAVIDAAPAEAIVCFPARRYRILEALRPRRGMTLFFERGAVLDGSVPVEDWSRSGGHWIAEGQTQHFEPTDVPCEANPAACAYEDLYLDGEPLQRVLDRSELRPGTFWFDKPGDTIHIADDPDGHRLEATVAETAIDAGGVHDVTVRNATIEKFAKHGIVTSDGWTVRDNDIGHVHSHGLRAFGATTVEGNRIHDTGNMGIFGEGDGLEFIGNELADNNYLGFDLWHGGATKITESEGTVVRGNWSHHNTGDGWWFDWNNSGAVVEGNVFEQNTRYGFFYEASFGARISGNVFQGNGGGDSGAGVWISTSRDVELAHNLFDHNRPWSLALVWTDRGVSERYGVRETTGLDVHDNTFRLGDGRIGVAFGSTAVYAAEAENRFSSNTYVVSDTDERWWRWGEPGADEHQLLDWDGWRDTGQDSDGSVSGSESAFLEPNG